MKFKPLVTATKKIDLRMATLAGSRTNIVIDLDGVDFIGSTAMRHLVLVTLFTLLESGLRAG